MVGMARLGLLVLVGMVGVGVAEAFGAACDRVACSCAGASLAHLRDRIYTAEDGDGRVGEMVAVKICDPFTAEELVALSPHCNRSGVASNHPTAVRYGSHPPTCVIIDENTTKLPISRVYRTPMGTPISRVARKRVGSRLVGACRRWGQAR